MRFTCVVVMLALLVAGCTDQGDTVQESSVDQEAGPENPGDPAPAPRRPSPTADPDPAPTTSAASMRNKTVSHTGSLHPGVGVPDVAMVSTGALLPMDRWFEHNVNGDVQDVTLTLTWQAASLGTETLRLSFSPVEDCGGGRCMTSKAQHIDGASPLTLKLEDLGWNAGDHVVAVWWGGDVAGGPEQDFSVEGTIVYA